MFLFLTFFISIAAPAADLPPFHGNGDCRAAVESIRGLKNFLRTHEGASLQMVHELIDIIERIDRTKAKVWECFRQASDYLEVVVANVDPNISTEERESLMPKAKRMWDRYQRSPRVTIIGDLYNRFWLWTPDDLTQLRVRLRNDNVRPFGTQIISLLEKASPEERKAFFYADPPFPSKMTGFRWFTLALEFKYGIRRLLNISTLVKSFQYASLKHLVPDPLSFAPYGERLPTTADFLNDVIGELQQGARAGDAEWLPEDPKNRARLIEEIERLQTCEIDLSIDQSKP